MNLRIIYALIAVILFILEILIASLLHHLSFVRGFLGDVLVVVLLFFFLKAVFIRSSSLKLIIAVLIFSFCIEFLQLFEIYPLLNIKSRILKIILGSVFDIWDLLAYLLGAVLSYFSDIYFIKNRITSSSRL